ncbi:hypothetical protein H257_12104 [Aphanomyces astaci]|uniref:Uncharacterized protein n=1 Tax=Aphanomyces astaci TaxID=112090 RepID=W4G2D1_APHAT|nr:hypothetical protein H257_12104 [Aphanomyces astaci]ETV73068.1 hypothetical protein H257_12104 [Aphanomyces astaci]|eukprot:XP_009837517.1 hypothetical protein H257_12104 [Aphanomyces astaci]
MSLLPTSAQPFGGTPLDESRPLAYTLWKTDFLSQATTRDLAGFYIEPNHVPRGNRLEALKVSKTYLELDEIDNWEFYVVDISLSEYDRNLRLSEIKAHTAAIQVKAINVEAGKKLAAQCSAAHTFLVSAISVNLRRLYQTTVCPYSLFELLKVRFESNPMDNNPAVIANHLRTLKFTEESCIDTLAVELTDPVKLYRVSMTPPSFNLLDASAISSIDYDTHIWNYHTLCAMSDTFINDKELWEVFAAVTHTVAAPAPPPTAISQPDGSYHVLNAFTIPAYAHHDAGNAAYDAVNRDLGCGRPQAATNYTIIPSSLNRVLEKPQPPSVLPNVFTTGSAPLFDIFASPSRPPLPSTLAPASALPLAPVIVEPSSLPANYGSPVDAGDLEVPSNEVLVTDRLHLYPPRPLF